MTHCLAFAYNGCAFWMFGSHFFQCSWVEQGCQRNAQGCPTSMLILDWQS